MRILLTGAAGFLGRQCRTALEAQGHDVLTTDRHGTVDYLGDLASRAFTHTLPAVDTVVHAAAVQYVSADLPILLRQRYFDRNNVLATRNICQRYAAADVHFVSVGTSMMYFQCGASSYSTGSVMRGQGLYSVSKLAAQSEIVETIERWCTIIPCIIGGVGREGLFRGFVRSIRNHGRALFPGRGEHPVHTVHVDDVASLIALTVNQQAEGFFNAGAPNPLSIMQWIDIIAHELNVPSVKVLHLPLRPLWAMAKLSGYRLLAREQLLMLAQPHVLDTSESLQLGWTPVNDSTQIVRDIAKHIAQTS